MSQSSFSIISLTLFLLFQICFKLGESAKIEPRCTSLESEPAASAASLSQICILETLQRFTFSNGRIPPKVTRKKISEALNECLKTFSNITYPTVIEETVYLTLGQYGHLSQVNVSKTLNFINEIQAKVDSEVKSYSHIFMLAQSTGFCSLYERFLLLSFDKNYFNSFLPEEGERCEELLKRIKQNAFYSYWKRGGVVVDQAQPIMDDVISKDHPLSVLPPPSVSSTTTSTSTAFPNTIDESFSESPVPTSSTLQSAAENKTKVKDYSPEENVSFPDRSKNKAELTKREKLEKEIAEMENEDDDGCCGSCNSKSDKSKDMLVLDIGNHGNESFEEDDSCCCSSKKKKDDDLLTEDLLKKKNESTNGEMSLKEEYLDNEDEEEDSCCSCSKKKEKKDDEDLGQIVSSDKLGENGEDEDPNSTSDKKKKNKKEKKNKKNKQKKEKEAKEAKEVKEVKEEKEAKEEKEEEGKEAKEVKKEKKKKEKKEKKEKETKQEEEEESCCCSSKEKKSDDSNQKSKTLSSIEEEIAKLEKELS